MDFQIYVRKPKNLSETEEAELIQFLEEFDEIDHAEKAEVSALGETILIALITKLIVEVISKTDSWDKLVTFLVKLLKKLGERLLNLKTLLTIKFDSLSIDFVKSDTVEDIKHKISKLKKRFDKKNR